MASSDSKLHQTQAKIMVGNRHFVRRLLATAAVTALGAAGAALAVDAVRGLAQEVGGVVVDLDSAVAALAGLALGALLLVWCGGAAAGLVAAGVGSASRAGTTLQAVADATTPLLLRRLLAAAVGAAVLGGTAGPALAAERPAGTASSNASSSASSVTGPDLAWPSATRAAGRPASTPTSTPTSTPASTPTSTPANTPTVTAASAPPPPSAPVTSAPPAAARAEVVVQRGDSLWSIAARHLPPGSSRAAVAAAWPRWYTANRAVIGADPDALRPGQRLVAP